MGPTRPSAASAAADHRIGPLLWRALGAADALDALGPDRAALGGAGADAFAMEALLLIPRAVALAIGPLTEAGLEPVVFKGPVITSRAIPQPGLRPMEDIDVLLPRADHRHTLAALRARPDGSWCAPPTATSTTRCWTHPKIPSLALELHFGLEGTSQRVTALDPGRLWACRRPLECAGTPAFGLPPAEELVVLAAHAGKPHHGFVRLMWIADLAMIVGDAARRGTPDRLGPRARRGRGRPVRHRGGRRARNWPAAPASTRPPGSSRCRVRGWRGDAMRRLLSVTWPLTHLELPGYQLNYSLTDARARRVKILLVLLASGHGVGRRARRLAGRDARVPVPGRRGLGAGEDGAQGVEHRAVARHGRRVRRVEAAVDEPAERLGRQHQVGRTPAAVGAEVHAVGAQADGERRAPGPSCRRRRRAPRRSGGP